VESHQRNRRLVEDFAERSLAAIPSEFGRLAYVASLRDVEGGCYRHDGLSALYPEVAVQQALSTCHQGLFLRLLETPLESQEIDLRLCLAAIGGGFENSLAGWREQEVYCLLPPAGLPAYLEELFASNVRALLAILTEERLRIQSAA